MRTGWRLAADDVGRFEEVVFGAPAATMRATIDAVPANPDGYALLDAGDVRASLSTNPYARGLCSAVGATQCAPDALSDVVAFFDAHGIRPRVRVPPLALDAGRAALLAGHGLRHVAFQAILHAPIDALPSSAEDAPSVAIEEVRDAARFKTFLDAAILGWGIPAAALEAAKVVRRPWLGAPGHRFYLATVDGVPAAHGVTFASGDVGYLSAANTLPAFRRRGLHAALIRRRIADARGSGKQTIVGAAELLSTSYANQLHAGLRVAYTAAFWERPEA